MTPLIVNPRTVELLFAAQGSNVRDPVRLDVSSRGLPPFPGRRINVPAAREAVGERLLRLLSGVAVNAALVGGRHPKVPETGCDQRLRIMSNGHDFEPFLHPYLENYYGLARYIDSYGPAVRALAEDFVAWVRARSADDPAPMGLTAEDHDKQTQVYIRCEPPPEVRFSTLEGADKDEWGSGDEDE